MLGLYSEQFDGLDEAFYQAMMGEYILYYQGKVFSGIYDDRFLVKPTKSALTMMPDVNRKLLYEGATEILLVDNVDDERSCRPRSGDGQRIARGKKEEND